MTARIIMPQTLARHAQPGELLKRPGQQAGRRQKSRPGREVDSSYRDLIRQLPCLKCGMEPCGECAHVRENSAALGNYQATGKKPSDYASVPLCPDCHRNDPESQHKIGEFHFWHLLGIRPLLVCQDLQKVAPDLVRMRAVIMVWIARQEPVL